jgi:hypothetical protein
LTLVIYSVGWTFSNQQLLAARVSREALGGIRGWLSIVGLEFFGNVSSIINGRGCSMSRLHLAVLLFCLCILSIVGALSLSAFQVDSLLTMSEFSLKLKEMTPKPGDFTFHPPVSWGHNLVLGAKILFVSAGESVDSAGALVDNVPYSTWHSNSYKPRPVVVVDLGREVTFNRIVIFNRHTDNRGTAGGNNATSTLALSTSLGSGHRMDSISALRLSGPHAICFRVKGSGQMCTFLDDPKPNLIRVKPRRARLLRLEFREAFWGEDALDEWKSSIALSEVMLFNSADDRE